MSGSTVCPVQVRVRGELSPTWSTALMGLAVEAQPEGTTLVSGELPDQAALHGLLTAIRDLGLMLVSVETDAAADARTSGTEP